MSENSHILHTDQKLLHDFGKTIKTLFVEDTFYGVYQVGSSLERRDYRDIDLRVLVKDEHYDNLKNIIDIDMLGIAVSLWGQKTTGLPIDFQVQRMSDANREYKDKHRNAVSIGNGL